MVGNRRPWWLLGLLGISCGRGITPATSRPAPGPSPVALTQAPVAASSAPAKSAAPTPVQPVAADDAHPCAGAPAGRLNPELPFAPSACVVRVTRGSVAGVQVLVEGGGALRVHLIDTPLEITLSQTTARSVEVRTEGAVKLVGRAQIPAFGLVKPADLVPFVVHGGNHAQLADAHAVGTAAVGAALVGDSSVENASISCSSLTTLPTSPPLSVLVAPARNNRWSAGIEAALLHSAANSETAVTVRRPPEFSKVSARDGWLKLSARYNDGSWINGWVEAEAAHALSDDSGGGGVGRGIALCGGDLCGPGARSAPEQRGMPAVGPGTVVYTAAAGRRWAVITQTITVPAVELADGAWLRLEELPGIAEHLDCRVLERAFVSSRSAHFQKPQSPP